jgi:hypothetical protein
MSAGGGTGAPPAVTGSPRVEALGFSLTVPAGWDLRIYRRTPEDGGQTYPILHAATFPLSPNRGDFGGRAVEGMRPRDVFVALLDYGPPRPGAALFAERRPPWPLGSGNFHPSVLHRALGGQVGTQRFFTAAGRGLCLYAVIAAVRPGPGEIGRLDELLANLAIGPWVPP